MTIGRTSPGLAVKTTSARHPETYVKKGADLHQQGISDESDRKAFDVKRLFRVNDDDVVVRVFGQ